MSNISVPIRILGMVCLAIAVFILAAFLLQWVLETWLQVVEPVVEPRPASALSIAIGSASKAVSDLFRQI